MMPGPTEISFQVWHENIETIVRTRTGAYRNLMEPLNNSLSISMNSGNAGEPGRCATYAVEIEWADGIPRARERNEESTLGSQCESQPLLRLARQVDVNEKLQSARVYIRQEGAL